MKMTKQFFVSLLLVQGLFMTLAGFADVASDVPQTIIPTAVIGNRVDVAIRAVFRAASVLTVLHEIRVREDASGKHRMIQRGGFTPGFSVIR